MWCNGSTLALESKSIKMNYELYAIYWKYCRIAMYFKIY